MPDHDLAGIYRVSRERLLALMPSLTPEQLTTMVPACPAWRVRDVVAHLSGVAADLLGGRMNIPTPDITARQVDERRTMDIDEICAEWSGNGAAVDALIAGSGSALILMGFDCWSHDQDVHNALGMVAGRSGPGLALVAGGIWKMKRIVRSEGLPPLRVITETDDWLIGDGGRPGATLRIDAYELARMVVGRRSADQMAGYDWDGDPAPYLPHIPAFDPPRSPIVE